MKINIELDTEHDEDARALAALVSSLTIKSPPVYTQAHADVREFIAPADNYGAKHCTEVSPDVAVEAVEDEPERDDNPEGAPALDSRGLPWDERIHAGTKATNADGSWRNKRGVDKDLLEEVEAELRGESTASGVTTPDSSLGQTEHTLENAPIAPEPPEKDTPPSDVPAAPTPSELPEPPSSPTEEHPSFKDAMAVVTAGQRDGSIDQTAVTEAAKALGLTSVIDLAKPDNAHLRAAFIATLG